LVFLAVFVVLAAAYYVYEYRGAETRKEAEEKERLVLSFEPDRVTELTLKRPGERIVIRKEHDAWTVIEPVSGPADKNIIEQVLDTISNLRYERDLGSQSDLGPFGLSEPTVSVGVSSDKGTIGEILTGDSTADGANLYVKRSGDDMVFTVSQSVKGKLDRTLFDLRDKTVLDFSIPDINEMRIYRNDRAFAFKKTPEGDWSMASPEERRADTGAITSVLDAVRYGRIKRFVEEEAEDLKQYGLEEPQARIELVMNDQTRSLSFDETSRDAKLVYAQRDNKRQVVELDAEIMNKLSGDVSHWRDKRLAKFRMAEAQKLAIDAPAGKVMLERVEGEPGEWKLTEPEAAAADDDRVQSLLSELAMARITRFLTADEAKKAGPAFEKQTVQVSVWEKDTEAPEVIILAEAEGEPTAYARIAETGEIVSVAQDLPAKLVATPQDLKDRSVLRFTPADVEKIEVAKGDEKPAEIVRKDIEWKVPRGLKAEPYEIDQLLWDLADLKYLSVETKQEAKEYGFESPVLTIKLWQAKAKTPVLLVVGKKTETGAHYVRANEDATVMEADGALIEKWVGMMKGDD
jgi:hypothetical protein